ncbi:hypothetical protein KY320_04025 [Candidatus Woesearchaeota archaeon]|nr:hypothetical protein [Candidatus Woesearchaeota archaeon]
MEIYELFAGRRQKIEKMLQGNGHSMKLEQQAELRGAMCEIELFLKTLEHYHKTLPQPPEPQEDKFKTQKFEVSKFSLFNKRDK